VNALGSLLIAGVSNNPFEKVSPAGGLSVVAGAVGRPGLPTRSPASSKLEGPDSVTVDVRRDLFMADWVHGMVEKVTF
jgi:hypothetical protein